MKPIYSIYLDFYCSDVDCDLMDCKHPFVGDGSGFRINFELEDVCLTCWVRYRRVFHVEGGIEDHEPTGPGSWDWH